MHVLTSAVMTLETAMLLICSAVFLLLVLVIVSVSRSVKKSVAGFFARECKDIRPRQEELREAQAALGERTDKLGSRQADMRQSVEKAAESVAQIVAQVKTLDDSIEQRLTGLGDAMEKRLKALEDGRAGADTDRARLSDRVKEIDGLIGAVRDEMKMQAERVDGLRFYLENTFQRDLKGAMKSFDDTVCSVLGEMKDELLQGVSRIEQLESAVVNRQESQRRISERGTKEVRQLLSGGGASADGQAGPIGENVGESSAESSAEPPTEADEEQDATAAESSEAEGGGVKFKGAPKAPVAPVSGDEESKDEAPVAGSDRESDADVASGSEGDEPNIPKKNVTLEDISRIVDGRNGGKP